MKMEAKSHFEEKFYYSAIQLNVDVFIFPICCNNFLTSWRKLSCLVFSSMNQQIRILEKVQLILCCRFANQETKIIVELCCLNVGVCSTAQAIFVKLNQFIENIFLIGWSIRQLLPAEQQSWNTLLIELSEKSKLFLLTVFPSVFGICRSQTEVVLKWPKLKLIWS